MADDSSDHPRHITDASGGNSWLGDAAAVFGLWSLAVTQPLLDLLGRNPEFFVSAALGTRDIVLLALVVAAAGPVAAVVVTAIAHRLDHRLARALHLLFVGLASTLWFGVLLHAHEAVAAPASVSLAATGGLLVAVGYARSGAGRRAARYLALAGLLFLGHFLLASRTSELVWGSEATALSGVSVGAPAPIVWVMLDELPVASLMTAEGQIDASRYPNLARLASTSTWYRNATASSWSTTVSVPAALTGRFPDGQAVPTSVGHPTNLFTLLGSHYDLFVEETVTDLCPASLCDPEADGSPRGRNRLAAALADVRVVYAHQVMPHQWRGSLAPIDTAWGDFGAGTADAPVSGAASEVVDPEAAWMARGGVERSPAGQGRVLRDLLARRGATRPTLHYAHVLLPHVPWLMTPSGATTIVPTDAPRGHVDDLWEDDANVVRFAYQRSLLQVGYVDLLVGELLDDLEHRGVLDETMIVLTSDHGATFRPGTLRRAHDESTIDEVYRPLLLVHYPGQHVGSVDDRPAQLLDLVPTIAEVLALTFDDPPPFDGRSLRGEPLDAERHVLVDGDRVAISSDVEGLLALAAANAAVLGPQGGWDAVSGPGRWGDLVGRSVSDLHVFAVPGATASVQQQPLLDDHDPDRGMVPILLTGELNLPPDTTTEGEAVVALNGTIAGVLQGFDAAADQSFYGLVGERFLRAGTNSVAVYLPQRSGDEVTLRSVTMREVRPTRLVEASGAQVLHTQDGRRIPVVTRSDLQISIAEVADRGRTTVISGWAGDVARGRPADQILLLVDGTAVDATLRIMTRPDVVEAFDAQGLRQAGFALLVDTATYVPPDATLSLVAVFGDEAAIAPVPVPQPG